MAKGLLAPLNLTCPVRRVHPDESERSLLKQNRHQDSSPSHQSSHPDLVDFLQNLHREMPSGQVEGFTVIPYCAPNLAEEIADLYRDALLRRELEMARAKEGANAAVELAPRDQLTFMDGLKCLLDEICLRYADPE